MLFLVLVYYLHSIDASPILPINSRSFEPNSCTDITLCRTVWNIIWSCLSTIFLCTWVAVHPNIPYPREREAKNRFQKWIRNPLLSFAEHRLPLFVCALLVPEYVLSWAIRQYLTARKIGSKDEGELEHCTLGFNSSNSLLDLQWSKTHGFFIIMGGFHLFKRGSKDKHSLKTTNNVKPISHEKDIPLHPLAAIDLYGDNPTLDIDFSSFYIPTEAEIEDKGKSDWLAKSLVLVQMSWFVMQCIARAIEHLPITHLEIVTIAYVAMNFVMYILWWNKPLDVNQPIRVFRKSDPRVADNGIDSHGEGESRPSEMHPQPILEGQESTLEAVYKGLRAMALFIVGGQDVNVNLSHEDRVPMFWANGDDDNSDASIAVLIVFGVGVCFGAIHCIAWYFSFPTHTELLIWRISCVAITTLPIYIPLAVAFMGIVLDDIVYYITMLSIFPAVILYVIARAVTLVLAFTSLRDLPPGAFNTVHWTTFIPHI